jgi:Leucine-rich repeat (LRR) protein
MKKLTADIVRLRTKCDKLDSVKNINLWGNELEDVSVVKNMPNLEVVSLSVNKIRSLKDFGNLKNLRELYLRKNMITDLEEIRHLSKCPSLRTLWLSENPIADQKGYRMFVISLLPQITKLDDNIITADEKLVAQNTHLEDSIEFENQEVEENIFQNQYESSPQFNEVKEEIYNNNVRNKKIVGGVNIKKRQEDDIINNFAEMAINEKKETVAKDLRRRNTTNDYVEPAVYQKKPIDNEYVNNKRIAEDYNFRNQKNEQESVVKRTRVRTPETRNVFNCVLLLLNELNENELDILRNEIDKKLS